MSEPDIRIPFYRPYLTGREQDYVMSACSWDGIQSDGVFSEKCLDLLKSRFGMTNALLTPSCTAALELSVRLAGVGPGDEVVMPSFAFSSAANAVLLAGAKPVFVDIRADTLNIDAGAIEHAITDRSRAIIVVHYGGVACDMDPIMDIARRQDLFVIEDAAQALGARYKEHWLGTIGHLGAFSFHYTKNVLAGEGGAMLVNDPNLVERAHIIRDKGTNRRKFMIGEIDKYTWVDIGSSLVPNELACAFLLAQLEGLEDIAKRRECQYNRYVKGLEPLSHDGHFSLPSIPNFAHSNHHIFYILLRDGSARDELLTELRSNGIQATFHFVPLHSSPMGRLSCQSAGSLSVTDSVAACQLRLPFFVDITQDQQDEVIQHIHEFFRVE